MEFPLWLSVGNHSKQFCNECHLPFSIAFCHSLYSSAWRTSSATTSNGSCIPHLCCNVSTMPTTCKENVHVSSNRRTVASTVPVCNASVSNTHCCCVSSWRDTCSCSSSFHISSSIVPSLTIVLLFHLSSKRAHHPSGQLGQNPNLHGF